MSITINDKSSSIIYKGRSRAFMRIDKDVLLEGLNYINTVLLLPDNTSGAFYGRAVYLDNDNLIKMYLKVKWNEEFFSNGWYINELNDVADDLQRRVFNAIITKDSNSIRDELIKLNIDLLKKLKDKIGQ